MSSRAENFRVTRALAVLVALCACVGAVGAVPGDSASPPRRELWAFTAPWDTLSDASFAANAARFDAGVTGWIALDTVTQQPALLYPDTLLRSKGPRRLALVTSWYRDRFHPGSVAALGGDRVRLGRVAGQTARLARNGGYRGLILDFEGQSVSDVPVLVAVARAFADSARAHGVGPVSMAIPATDTLGYPAKPLLASVDALVVMLYDQHWTDSEPGPIAEPGWARQWLATRVREVGASHLVAALPLYGYAWTAGKPTETIGYAAAQRLSAAAGAPLTRDSTGWLRGTGPHGTQVWVSDAVIVQRLARDARALGVTRIALWRLGLEDPATWSTLAR